ncbi:MBL fold metallo-hydrolase [Acidaminobacter sp. JC074]|uniref:MBL fold metallo-hydrolase n=1 Tax=Acidaminobacter sp. JC074 TaxID=2530199 RepID=UPI001F0CF517|nr:MBL fold metallo-hydrolase [Acidaminobacter sp. JC074]
MKVIVLVEDTQESSQVDAAFGLSLYIEYDGTKILYDLGPDRTFIENAKKLNVAIDEVDYVVLSHGHLDHTGGLNYLKDKPVYIQTGASEVLSSRHRDISMPDYDCIRVDKEATIESNIHLLTNQSKFGFVPDNDHLFRNDCLDDFSHELMLVIELPSSLVLFSGCSHQGISNMIYTAENKFSKPVSHAFGGMHLKDYEETYEFEGLKDELLRMSTIFYTGHCTGRYAYRYLQKHLKGRLHRLSSGKEFIF